MFACLPRNHPLAGKAKLRLEDLRDESWLLGTTNSCPDASIFLRACERAGFEPKIAFNSDDYAAMQGFVAAGIGVSLIPELALTSIREDVVIRSLTPQRPVAPHRRRDARRRLPLRGGRRDARGPPRGRSGVRERDDGRARARQLRSAERRSPARRRGFWCDFRVRPSGLEPPRAFAHSALNAARLPIPPWPRGPREGSDLASVGPGYYSAEHMFVPLRLEGA